MGLFSSLFSKKEVAKSQPAIIKHQDTASPVKRKGFTDPNGLYPSELVMLAVAERYKIIETDFPRYLTYDFDIANPNVTLKSLQNRDFIRESTALEALSALKVVDLKKIAEVADVQAKKQRDPLVEALTALGEDTLAPIMKERTWKVTESGQTALNYNKYIQFFIDKHSYSLCEVGIDIWTINEALLKQPKARYRDVIWHQLTDRMNEASVEMQTKPYSGTAAAGRYCNCYRIKALYLEEEKSYVNAADYYFQYIFKRINLYSGLNFLVIYRYACKDKERQSEAIESFYNDAKIYPFQHTDIIRLKEELGIDEIGLRDAFKTSFVRACDSGILSVEQTVDFVMLELAGNTEKSKMLCEKAAKEAAKKISI